MNIEPITKEQKKHIDENVRLFIGIPHNHDEMKNDFRRSLERMKSYIGGKWYLNHQGIDSYVNDNGWVIHFEQEFPIEIARNNICNLAKDNGFTHIMMIDSDMKFDFDLPYRLLLHNVDCVAPLMKVRYPDENQFFRYAHFHYQDNNVYPVFYTDAFKGLISEKDIFSGTGCILFKTEILDKIKFPYFKFVIEYLDKYNKIMIGEDAYFGIQLVKNNIITHIDTNIILGHLAVFPIPFEIFYQNSTALKLNYRREQWH